MAMTFVGMAPLPASSIVRRTSSLAPAPVTASSGLCSAFLSPASSLSFTCSTFTGLSVIVNFNHGLAVEKKRRVFIVRAGKAALCQTKRNRSRKSLSRTHGFRIRMRTTSGRAVLKRRRAKGRKVLCTKSYPSSGKRA